MTTDSNKLDNIFATALNVTAAQIGAWAHRKGFREEFNLIRALEIQEEGPNPTGLTPHHIGMFKNAVVSMKLMLAVSELSEALESLRNTGAENIVEDGNFGEEIADVIIRCLDLCDALDIDIGQEVVSKLAANEGREYKHGRVL